MGETLEQRPVELHFNSRSEVLEARFLLSAAADWSTNLGSDGTVGNVGFAG